MRAFKLLRDKFASVDGLIHIEAQLQAVATGPHVDAACGRWFTTTGVEYLPDAINITCMGCIAQESQDG